VQPASEERPMPVEPSVRVGNVTITPIVESALWSAPSEWLPEEDSDAVIAATREWCEVTVADDGWVVVPVRCYVVQSGGRTILVDSGQGEDSLFVSVLPGWRVDSGDLVAELATAGIAVEDIDQVVMTHIHPDHTGWNFRTVDGTPEPTFPNARYLLSEPDWALVEQYGPLAAPIASLRERGLLDLVAADTALTEEVRLLESHGHTPGHVCIEIESEGDRAILIGDVVHHKIALANPGAPESGDSDQALATRLALYDRVAGSDTLILASHFEAPAVGYFKRRGAGYEFSETR
jgi:glyoxylase-like metal-dependent hydrolase (beta-lactamase superfamily II)